MRWSELFEKHRGVKPFIAWAKEKKRVGQIIAQHGVDVVLDMLERFFTCDDDWIRDSEQSIGAFMASFNKLLTLKPKSDALGYVNIEVPRAR